MEGVFWSMSDNNLDQSELPVVSVWSFCEHAHWSLLGVSVTSKILHRIVNPHGNLIAYLYFCCLVDDRSMMQPCAMLILLSVWFDVCLLGSG